MVRWGACRGHILQQEDSLCYFTSAQIPQGSICDTVARVEAETCFRPIAGLRHKVICCCYLEPRPVSVYEGESLAVATPQCRWVGFHSFLFQTLALAVECQTLIWEPPIMSPCLYSGTCSPEEGRAGPVTPLSCLWNVGLVHRPF